LQGIAQVVPELHGFNVVNHEGPGRMESPLPLDKARPLGKPPDPLGDIPIVVEDITLAGSKGVTTTCSPAAN